MEPTIVRVPPELDLDAITALARGIEKASGRVLVLEGADGVFCRGMSLADGARERDNAAPASPNTTRQPGDAARAFAACLRTLRCSKHATIAVVDGEALGGGVGIAAACDLVLATPRASFGLPELLFGLMPAIVFPVLTERISPQQARLLALRAQSVSAERAVALGLADEIVPSDELARTIRRSARELSRVDPAEFKRYTAHGLDLATGAEITAAALASPRLAETMRTYTAEGMAPWLT